MNSESVHDTPLPVNLFPTQIKGEGAAAALPGMALRPAARLRSSRALSDELVELATAVWRQRGLALVDPLLLQQDEARRQVIDEANRLYGRRSSGQEG